VALAKPTWDDTAGDRVVEQSNHLVAEVGIVDLAIAQLGKETPEWGFTISSMTCFQLVSPHAGEDIDAAWEDLSVGSHRRTQGGGMP
jgi:hypothetical protein